MPKVALPWSLPFGARQPRMWVLVSQSPSMTCVKTGISNLLLRSGRRNLHQWGPSQVKGTRIGLRRCTNYYIYTKVMRSHQGRIRTINLHNLGRTEGQCRRSRKRGRRAMYPPTFGGRGLGGWSKVWMRQRGLLLTTQREWDSSLSRAVRTHLEELILFKPIYFIVWF